MDACGCWRGRSLHIKLVLMHAAAALSQGAGVLKYALPVSDTSCLITHRIFLCMDLLFDVSLSSLPCLDQAQILLCTDGKLCPLTEYWSAVPSGLMWSTTLYLVLHYNAIGFRTPPAVELFGYPWRSIVSENVCMPCVCYDRFRPYCAVGLAALACCWCGTYSAQPVWRSDICTAMRAVSQYVSTYTAAFIYAYLRWAKN